MGLWDKIHVHLLQCGTTSFWNCFESKRPEIAIESEYHIYAIIVHQNSTHTVSHRKYLVRVLSKQKNSPVLSIIGDPRHGYVS